jgi:hypothetical protein
MSSPSRAVAAFVLVAVFFALADLLSGAAQRRAPIERTLQRTFQVAAGSLVAVRVSGGAIVATTGRSGVVEATLRQIVDTDSEQRADELLADFEIGLTQQGDEVTLVGRRIDRRAERDRWGREGVRLDATLTVPADVRLQLDTSGGPITVRGERTAALNADTSGGRIAVDGGPAVMYLDTSGGSISVGRALRSLRANTSGGGITVDYVGPEAADVMLDTSGGSIRVGVDPAARLDLSARTSGGGVSVEGLRFDARSVSRSRASGALNGGGGRLSAATSGGSIDIHAATR